MQQPGNLALGSLKNAQHELNISGASDIYLGHRSNAIKCVEHAIRGAKGEATWNVQDQVDQAIGDLQFCLSAPS